MVLGQNDLNNGNNLSFFKLYATFLEVDSIISFTLGRNRSLIKTFYNFYYVKAMSKKYLDDNMQDKLNQAKILLKKEFKDYMSQRGKYRIEIWADSKISSTCPHIVENPNISEAFLYLVDAVEQYKKWRNKLNKEQILIIYTKNLEDRQKYYTNNDEFNNFNEKLLQKIEVDKLKSNEVLKQTLIEFHNAISHLVAVYYGRNQENNKNRAINHFKRGALDSYKAIIKDFYHLYNAKKVVYEPLTENLKNIRKKEYLGIGSDNVIFKEYKNFTDSLITNI